MQIGRWGNSLAVRLPNAVVEALHLKEGDDIAIEATEPRTFRVSRDGRKDAALDALRDLGWTLPADYTFSRDEANERGR